MKRLPSASQRKKIAPYSESNSHEQAALEKLFQQGFALHRQGQLEQAQTIYAQILGKNASHFDALHLLGVITHQTKNFAVAAALIGKAILVNPNHAAAHANRGLALYELQLWDDAIASYDQAISLQPDFAEAHLNRGNALQQLGHLEEALASYDNAIRIKADYAEAYLNRGNRLKELKRFEEALASYDQAMNIKPEYAQAHSNRGTALQELRRFEEALANYEQAIHLKADYSEAYLNQGNALQEIGQFEKAIANYDHAIRLSADFAEAYWNKSLALLITAQFRQGWELYEWRWKKTTFNSPPRRFTQPLWQGAENLENKTILLHAEQGLGDSIQLCRYAERVANSGATVLLEVPQALMGLFDGLPGVHRLLETGQPLPAFDYHCPLLTLPLAFRTEIHTIPSPAKYLSSHAEKREIWSQRLGAKTRPRVGIVWSGGTAHKNDHRRSMTFAEFTHHLPDHCDYVSLQKELRAPDKDRLANSPVRHVGDELLDFTDTAALCDLMDVVISVDTSVAHLAAALGKPTWIVLPYLPDWRWLLDREDCPWYASVKLYRQGQDRQWAPVLARVANDLVRITPSALAR